MKSATMSQIELGEDVAPTTATELTSDSTQGSGTFASRHLLRPSFQSTSQPRSTLLEPSRTSDSGPEVTRAHTRRVGAGYLAQLGLTTVPLILVDLALLTAAIAVAWLLVRYVGIG